MLVHIMDGLDVPVEAVTVIRSFYLLLAAAIIAMYSIPPLKSRFLAYGARASDRKLGNGVLDRIAAITVPHSFFSQFYAVSGASCILWAWQIYSQGQILTDVLKYTEEPVAQVSGMQVAIAWFALGLLSLRRFLECFESGPSRSTMFVGHWIMGLLFYAVTSVAVWIEGDRRIITHPKTEELNLDWLFIFITPQLSYGKTFSIILGALLFFSASATQASVHGYLRDLKNVTDGKYAFPVLPLFDFTITPHYTAECVAYLGLALILAPEGHYFSTTMLCCLTFVVVNLGVTADGTMEWYRQKFGDDLLEGKSRMIPGIW